MKIEKEKFKNDFHRILQAKSADGETCTLKEVYGALSQAAMLGISESWKQSRNASKKRCGYFSAEFLLGRLIYSNLLNLDLLQTAKEALAAHGAEIGDLEEVEDAALGNGGLGRLAACFLDSAASQGICLDGYGLRYRYGLFKQKFEDGFQKETGDDWLSWGDPWSVRRETDKVKVEFGDFSVWAVPYDTPIIGYKNGVFNTLRLWQSEPLVPFDFFVFDKMEGQETALGNYKATCITDVLYPNDNTEEGKILRLRQEYLMVSASLQDFMRKYDKIGLPFSKIFERQVFQLNDTHPVLAIPEFIRLLTDRGVAFEEAFQTARKTFRFTNHTIMGEALEKWKTEHLEKILPDVWRVIERINQRLEREGLPKEKYYVIKDGYAHMAQLAVYVCEKVNGVAQIHTEILKAETFSDWFVAYPKKFVNVTNGITPRRWFLLNNPKMAKEVSQRIGEGWINDLEELQKLKEYIQDEEFRRAFVSIKQENKEKLSAYCKKREGIELPANFVFDIQIKRLHEYKRQLLNAFSILHIYREIKAGRLENLPPTAFIFGAKAAPGYYNAKGIIKYINEIGRMVNSDNETKDRLRVAFVQNYNVSYAEKLVCAGDISEQISMAGMEASGTGNMKFMLNGTVTLGTMDGANVEICKEAGIENNYIFGARVEEVEKIKKEYSPAQLLKKDETLRSLIGSLIDGTFSDGGTGYFRTIYDSLTNGEDADRYLVLYDFEDYIKTKLRCLSDYGSEAFITKSLTNMACAGKFSSDRSIREYAKMVWDM